MEAIEIERKLVTDNGLWWRKVSNAVEGREDRLIAERLKIDFYLVPALLKFRVGATDNLWVRSGVCDKAETECQSRYPFHVMLLSDGGDGTASSPSVRRVCVSR